MANPIFQDFSKKTSDSEVTKSIKSWQLEERYNMESDYNNGRSADFSHFSSTSNHIVGGRPRYSGVNAFMDPTFNACITPRSLELDPTILRYSRPLSSALEAVFLTPTTDPGHQLIHPRRHPRSSSSTILSAIENLETPPSRLPLGYKETPTTAPVKIVQGEDVLVMDGILVDSLSSAGGDRSIVRSSLSSDSSSGSSIGSNTLYKTEMCRSWEETGICRYGSKCQFAHGKEELRPHVRSLKLKPESQGQICKSFAVTGTCTFGSKCRYTHSVTMTRATPNTEAERMVASTLGLGSTPEDVAAAHAYTNQALYGPSQRRRLPAFLDICPE